MLNCMKEWWALKKSRIMFIGILAGISLIGAMTLSACAPAPAAKNGDTVQVNYTLSLADGTEYETSVGKEPLTLVVGGGDFLPDFEGAIVGMKAGESKTINIPAADAYGPYRDDLIITVQRTQIDLDAEPKVGDQLQGTNGNGQTMAATITAVTDTTLTLDANHPLAGKDLTFKIDLLKIN
jgi:peptidylprolyl isomerase